MELKDIERREQFSEYYKEHNLKDISDKIKNLINVMGIRAIRFDGEETREECLAGLEELALLGYWEAS